MCLPVEGRNLLKKLTICCQRVGIWSIKITECVILCYKLHFPEIQEYTHFSILDYIVRKSPFIQRRTMQENVFWVFLRTYQFRHLWYSQCQESDIIVNLSMYPRCTNLDV